jgi:hypothetical protein
MKVNLISGTRLPKITKINAREAALERIVAAMDLEGFTTKDCKIK